MITSLGCGKPSSDAAWPNARNPALAANSASATATAGFAFVEVICFMMLVLDS
jgi:hypothetical protein